MIRKLDTVGMTPLLRTTFDLVGIDHDLKPQQLATLKVHPKQGESFDVSVVVQIDTPVEKDDYRAAGILPYILAQILA
jgi:aconitate hydratase